MLLKRHYFDFYVTQYAEEFNFVVTHRLLFIIFCSIRDRFIIELLGYRGADELGTAGRIESSLGLG